MDSKGYKRHYLRLISIAGSATTPGWSYAYDGLGRLLSATGSLGTRTYAYDTFGNLTSLGGASIAVDHGTNRLLGGAVYDGRGNMTDQPVGTWTRRLRWDEENRLLAVWAEGAGVPPDTWAFAYDHNGERVLKYRIDAGAVAEAELYLRDEAGNVLTEMDWVDTGAGGYWARAKDHVYLGRDLIGSFDYTGGAPHIVTYARDHLGTQRAEVWGLDTATATDLWAYGDVANTKLSGDAPALTNGAHLFTGHERDFMGTEADPLEGLDYMHARYYSHDLGRFLSVDPVEGSVGSSQSWNRYGYSLGNPLRYIDPWGRKWRNVGGRWTWFPDEDEHGSKKSKGASQEGGDNGSQKGSDKKSQKGEDKKKGNDAEGYDELVTFDGKTLTLYLPGGRTIRLKAVAGRLNKGKADPTLQRVPGVGPIPEGEWRFDPARIQKITLRDLILGIAELGRWPGSVLAWGRRRVWLRPAPGTRTFGRSGFTIHGGATYGSAGCIDLAGGAPRFFDAVDPAPAYVPVFVDYPDSKE